MTSTADISLQPVANLLWLVDFCEAGSLAVLSELGSRLPAALAPHFDTTLSIRWDEPALTSMSVEAESLDVVVIQGSPSASSSVPPDATLRALLPKYWRAMKNGAGILIIQDNPLGFRGLTAAGLRDVVVRRPRTLPQLERALRRCGFTRVKSFFLTPDATMPREIVPARAALVTEHARLLGGRTRGAAVRRIAGRIGLACLLYPAQAVVATK